MSVQVEGELISGSRGHVLARVFRPVPQSRLRVLGATLLAYAMLLLAQVVVLVHLSPRFFWTDDAQTQYGPAAWWLGRQQDGLLPPLMNPELGPSNSFVADMQYGVLDPFHWLLQALAARFDDVVLFSAVYGALCMFVAGSGALVQLLIRGVRPALALATALGVGSSGLLLWFGSDWWPLMWSAGWLLWMWNGLSCGRRIGLVVLGVATAALFGSGYPYFLPAAVVLVAAHLAEVVLRHRARVLFTRPLMAQYLSMAAGVIVGAPSLLGTLEASGYIFRNGADPVVGNSSYAVPNLLDVLLGSPTLLGQLTLPFVIPATYSFVLAVPLIALVHWRVAVRAGGVLTGLALTVAGAAATQLPSILFGFRHPFLHMTVYQLALPVLVLTAVSAAPRVSRDRVGLALGLVAAQTVLALSRAPVFYKWHVVGGIGALVVLGAAVIILAGRERFRTAMNVVVVVGSATSVFLALGIAVSLAERLAGLRGVPQSGAAVGQPFRVAPGYEINATALSDFRQQASLSDTAVTVYDFGSLDMERVFGSGVLPGNQNLLANLSPGYGYNAAVSQIHRRTHECRGHWGPVCEPERLLVEVPGSGKKWIDLLSQNRVLVSAGAPPEVLAHLEENWHVSDPVGPWLSFTRSDPLPGRLSHVEGVDVDPHSWTAQLGRVGEPMDRYVVSTGSRPGALIFYTTYWPGLAATLDGEPVAVSDVDGTLLRVSLPAGLDDADLEVTYAPIGARILFPCLGGGTILLLVALFLGVRRSPRVDSEPPVRAHGELVAG